MYAHKLMQPASDLIKYRGNTGQIDRKDTIINILSKHPGLIGARIADKMYNRTFFPVSYGKVYEVLGQLCREGSVIRNGRYFYLTSDAVSHDMAVTAKVVDTLSKDGISLDKMRFLSSGIIMAGESFAADQRGENFNIDETVAAGVAAAPEQSVEASEEEIDAQIASNTDDILAAEQLEIEDPWVSMSDEEREELKAEADRLIEESYRQEEAEKLAAEEAYVQKKREAELRMIRSADDLVGKKVEINPGQYEGQVIGSVLEVRPSGMTFLITYSADPSIDFGTVLPLEYSNGLKYKVVFDFDAE